jgi:hypothetical protein
MNTYQNQLFESIENHSDKPQELPGKPWESVPVSTNIKTLVLKTYS